MTATIYKMDDYRKTPRAAVRHEVAIEGYNARQQREDIERLDAYKAAFVKEQGQ
jgi:hypothetical protein